MADGRDRPRIDSEIRRITLGQCGGESFLIGRRIDSSCCRVAYLESRILAHIFYTPFSIIAPSLTPHTGKADLGLQPSQMHAETGAFGSKVQRNGAIAAEGGVPPTPHRPSAILWPLDRVGEMLRLERTNPAHKPLSLDWEAW